MRAQLSNLLGILKDDAHDPAGCASHLAEGLKKKPRPQGRGSLRSSVEISTTALFALRRRVSRRNAAAASAHETQLAVGDSTGRFTGPVDITRGARLQGCADRAVRSQNDRLGADLRGISTVGNGDNPGASG